MADEISLEYDFENEIAILWTPYDKNFVEDFKKLVPYSGRNHADGLGWDEDEECWRFSVAYYDSVQTLVERYFGVDRRTSRLRNRLRGDK